MIGAAVLVLASSGADAAPSSSSAPSSYTVAENRVARVYRDETDDTVTCSKVNGRRNGIASDSYDVIEDLKLRGHYVAFIRKSCETSGFECAEGVFVADVRRDDNDDVFSTRGDGSTVVLRSNGSIAWSEYDIDPRYEDDRENIAVISDTRAGARRASIAAIGSTQGPFA